MSKPKIKKVLSNGTELGWLLTPEDESVVAVFLGQRVELYEGGDQLPVLSVIELELTAE